MIPQPRRSFAIPVWAEVSLLALCAIMAVVELLHAQWFFGVLFALSAVGFGGTFLARVFGGKKDD